MKKQTAFILNNETKNISLYGDLEIFEVLDKRVQLNQVITINNVDYKVVTTQKRKGNQYADLAVIKEINRYEIDVNLQFMTELEMQNAKENGNEGMFFVTEDWEEAKQRIKDEEEDFEAFYQFYGDNENEVNFIGYAGHEEIYMADAAHVEFTHKFETTLSIEQLRAKLEDLRKTVKRCTEIKIKKANKEDWEEDWDLLW